MTGAHAAQGAAVDNELVKRIFVILLMTLLAAAGAQELRVGVILPMTGQHAGEFEQLLTGVRRSINLQSSPALRNVELMARDDGGSPARAATLLRELVVNDDVHVIVCCTDEQTAAAVRPVADELQVLTLSLAGTHDLPANGMMQTLEPGLLASMRAVGLGARRHEGDLALLTTEGDRGDDVAEAFRAGALEAGLPVMRIVRFRSGSSPLTPEALLAATSQAEAIVVWANESDSREAVRSLRARGWTGPIILDYLQAAALASTAGLGELEFAVPPALITGGLPASSFNQPAVTAWRVASGAALIGGDATLAGALLYDALQLAIASYEQALVYGASLSLNSAQIRSALHDGLVGSGTSALAAGSYRYTSTSASLAQPAGLVFASGRNGRFASLGR